MSTNNLLHSFGILSAVATLHFINGEFYFYSCLCALSCSYWLAYNAKILKSALQKESNK
ncbi:MAG: hypothetical protein AB8B89_03215 [Gammaproteobacteria bacterium]